MSKRIENAKMQVVVSDDGDIVFGFVSEVQECWASFSIGELSSEQVKMVAERFNSAVRTMNRMVSIEVTSLEP